MKNIFAFLSCFIVLACGNPNETVEIKTLQPGDKAPGFNLKNVDEEMVSLEDYPDAKGFIVIFTANTCPIANAYEDRIIALGQKYNSTGYPVIAINANRPGLFSGDNFKKMQKKAKSKDFSFPYLFDEGQIVTDQYGARLTLYIFLLKKEGSGYKNIWKNHSVAI